MYFVSGLEQAQRSQAHDQQECFGIRRPEGPIRGMKIDKRQETWLQGFRVVGYTEILL